ncbi:hypothetical protein vseg_018023 [Gypsophila vaccaria]
MNLERFIHWEGYVLLTRVKDEAGARGQRESEGLVGGERLRGACKAPQAGACKINMDAGVCDFNRGFGAVTRDVSGRVMWRGCYRRLGVLR